jgi:hypothetical protein
MWIGRAVWAPYSLISNSRFPDTDRGRQRLARLSCSRRRKAQHLALPRPFGGMSDKRAAPMPRGGRPTTAATDSCPPPNVASVPLWWVFWLRDERLRKWKLQHNVTFVVCHHHRSRKQVWVLTLILKKTQDHGFGDLPSMISVTEFLALNVRDHVIADARVEEVTRHDAASLMDRLDAADRSELAINLNTVKAHAWPARGQKISRGQRIIGFPLNAVGSTEPGSA